MPRNFLVFGLALILVGLLGWKSAAPNLDRNIVGDEDAATLYGGENDQFVYVYTSCDNRTKISGLVPHYCPASSVVGVTHAPNLWSGYPLPLNCSECGEFCIPLDLHKETPTAPNQSHDD